MADNQSERDPLAEEWARAIRSGALRRARLRRAALIGAIPTAAGLCLGVAFAAWDYLGKAPEGAICDKAKGCRAGMCVGVESEDRCIEDCESTAKCNEGFSCLPVEIVSRPLGEFDPLRPERQSHGRKQYKCIPDAIAARMRGH
jgi:hypothetical protein